VRVLADWYVKMAREKGQLRFFVSLTEGDERRTVFLRPRAKRLVATGGSVVLGV
jgi:hypothetical protein